MAVGRGVEEMSEDTQEIKPCPFCGYKFGRVVGTFDIGHQVVCDACGACGPDQPETEDAIKEWNEAKR